MFETMDEKWFYVDTGAGDPAWNMGFDEAMLETVAAMGQPVLRFYAWSSPAATFGYFQKYEAVASMTSLRPLIRRPTGGGLVPHAADWTYSLSFPGGHAWYRLSAVESYRTVHEWLRRTFLACGLESSLSPCCVPAAPGQCFAGAERFDLLWRDRKLAGAAQRRHKGGLLIQGSVQPPNVDVRDAWQHAMLDSARETWNVRWNRMPDEALPESRTQDLVLAKYGSDAFNKGR